MKTVNRNREVVEESKVLDLDYFIPDHFPNRFTTKQWIDLLLKIKAEEDKLDYEYSYRLIYNYEIVEIERAHYRLETDLEYEKRILKEERAVKAEEKKAEAKRKKEQEAAAAEYAVYLKLKEKFEEKVK